MSDELRQLLGLPAIVVIAGKSFSIHKIKIKDIPNATRLLAENKEAEFFGLFLEHPPPLAVNRLKSNDAQVLIAAIEHENPEFFNPPSTDTTDPTDDSGWAFLLQKLTHYGHSQPQNYSIYQANAYMKAIEHIEKQDMYRMANAIGLAFGGESD